MQQHYDSARQFKLAEWICGCAILAAVSTFLIPVMASAKESAGNVTLSNAKARAMAASLYSEEYDSATSQTACVQEGPFITANGGCMDTATGTVWSGSYYVTHGVPGYPNFYEATDWCNALTDGGFDDWRLPAATTMLTAASHGAANYIEQAVTPPRNGWAAEFSSTTRKGGKEVLLVDLLTGVNAWVNVKAPGNPPRYTRVDLNCVRGPG